MTALPNSLQNNALFCFHGAVLVKIAVPFADGLQSGQHPAADVHIKPAVSVQSPPALVHTSTCRIKPALTFRIAISILILYFKIITSEKISFFPFWYRPFFEEYVVFCVSPYP